MEFHKKAAQIYQCWLKDHKKSKTGLDSPIAEESDLEDESDKSVSVSYEEAKEQAQEKIDTFLHAMDAYDFQRLVAELLKAIGYHVTWIAPPGKDGGVDIWPTPILWVRRDRASRYRSSNSKSRHRARPEILYGKYRSA